MTNKAHINKGKASRAAKEYIERAEKRIEREHEEAIIQIMNKRWFAPKTREGAIHKLKHDGGWGMIAFSTWYNIEYQGSYWTKIAKRVIRLCENTSGEFVILDEDTVSFLFKE